MAHLGFQLTGSGVTDCAGGCGEHVMTSDLSKPAYCGDGECVADDLDDDTAAPEHTGNRVWIVRAGTDGIGLDLFHVYAPDMDAARESAKASATAAGFIFGENFTVHALRDGDPIDWFARLGNNVVTDRPAVDYVEPVETPDLDALADVVAGLIFLAILGEVVEDLIKNDGKIPYEGDGFSPYM
jgi:hypothetical protein